MVEKILLDDQNYLKLVHLSEHASSAAARRRADVIRYYHDGLNTRRISEKIGLSMGRVRYWRREFVEKGMELFPEADSLDINSLVGYSPPAQAFTAITEDSPVPKTDGIPISDNSDFLQETATTLFNGLQYLHGMGKKELELLIAAVAFLNRYNEETKEFTIPLTQDIVCDETGAEFTDLELRMLMTIVHYRAGKINRKVINALSPYVSAQKDILMLVALFRVVLGLDASGSQLTTIVEAKEENSLILIDLDGPFAEVDAKSANKQAKLWMEVMNHNLLFQTVKDSVSDETIQELKSGFPKPMKSPGIEPWDSMAEAGRKVLKYYFAEMLAHEEGTKLGEDIEELHDMRVATRRMRSAFDVFGPYFRSKAIRSYLKGLRGTGKALGAVRDLDVFMEKANQYIENGPDGPRVGLSPLIEAWQGDRDAERERMLKHLNSSEYEQFKQEYNIFLNTPGMGARKTVAGASHLSLVQHAAPMLIYTRLAEVRAFDAVMANATIEQLHALRIEFKKLRYTVEFFREALGVEYREVIDDIKLLQDHLGDLNDADVACLILGDFLSSWEIRQMNLPLIERQNPEPVVGYLAAKHAERHSLMTTFPEAWNHFNRPEFRKNLALAISIL